MDKVNEIFKLRENFLATDNQSYIDFLKFELLHADKIIFDTNIYSPLKYEWMFRLNGDLEQTLVNLFNKGCDYEKRLLELLTQDERIMTTKGIIEEISLAPGYWKSRHEYDIERGNWYFMAKYYNTKNIPRILKQKIREYTATIAFIYNFLVGDDRVICEGYNDMSSNHGFRVLLRKLLDEVKYKNHLKDEISINDRKIIYTMLNESLTQPTFVASKDYDLLRLTKHVCEHLGSLNKKLEHHNLVVIYKENTKNLNTYILGSTVI